MLNGYKAVFFDVGGTLLRVHPSVGAVYERQARKFGFQGSAEDLDRQFHIEWQAVGGMESLGKAQGPQVERDFWSGLVRRVFAPFGGVADFDAFFDALYRGFVGRDNWRVYEDVLQSGILQRLRERGVVLGVVSNWDSRLPEILENVGLASCFDFVLASTVVGSAKPDPGIFLEALRLGGVAPGEACHIGDEPIPDIEGARNAGIDALLIDRKDRHAGAARRVRSFHDLD